MSGDEHPGPSARRSARAGLLSGHWPFWLRGGGQIEYIPFPEQLRGKYQSFTEADVSRLCEAGYEEPFTPLEEGIARCVQAWSS